uniref:Immunoglobulin subtype domain-containing protein n=1 Tax=Ursus americanus TaxID=9643 RepID=A0A452QJG1_URSAM
MSPVVISLTCLGEETNAMPPPPPGIYRKPSLLAQPGPLVKSGGNVTLHCCSEIVFESFIFHREGVSKDLWYLAGQRHHGGSHANFSMGPVTAAHGGTYRYFGSLNRSFHEWSAPSDSLDIMITDGNRLSLGSHLPTGNPRHLHVLAGPLVAIVFLTVLLFFLTRRWCPAKESESPEEETSACLGGVGEPGSLHLLVDSWFKAEATEVRLSRENSRAPILTNRMEMGRHDWDVSLNFGEVDSLTLLSGSNSRHSLHLAVLCYLYL